MNGGFEGGKSHQQTAASDTHVCSLCGREGSRGFHRIVMPHPEPNKWFCDNYLACHKRIKAKEAKSDA